MLRLLREPRPSLRLLTRSLTASRGLLTQQPAEPPAPTAEKSAKGNVLYSWGNGAFAGLGDGSLDDRAEPTLVGLLQHSNVQGLSVGWAPCVAVTESGYVLRWGWR